MICAHYISLIRPTESGWRDRSISGITCFSRKVNGEAPGFVLRRLYFTSALLDTLAGLARSCQSDGLIGS